MKYCAIIPARGKSKRIPNKNLILIGGKPLISYTIEIALNTKKIGKVLVSTDSKEIAAVSRRYGAEVVMRPDSISGDNSKSEYAILHALEHLESNEGLKPKGVIFLQATSPIREVDDIEKAINIFEEENLDSMFTGAPFPGFLWKDKEGLLNPVNFDYSTRPRHQDTPNYYMENGSFFIFKTNIIKKYKNRMGGKIGVYPMPMYNSFEIDNAEDVDLIKSLIKNKKTDSFIHSLLKNIKLVVFDFDGVMTNNKVFVNQEGIESVVCDRSDGLGISKMINSGYELLVLSTEKNKVVKKRCEKLDINCIQGSDDKIENLRKYVEKRGFESKHIAYVGNDINDLECMRWVSVPIAVNNADYRIKEISSIITTRNGGDGAVREISEWFLDL